MSDCFHMFNRINLKSLHINFSHNIAPFLFWWCRPSLWPWPTFDILFSHLVLKSIQTYIKPFCLGDLELFSLLHYTRIGKTMDIWFGLCWRRNIFLPEIPQEVQARISFLTTYPPPPPTPHKNLKNCPFHAILAVYLISWLCSPNVCMVILAWLFSPNFLLMCAR